jgi:hypothetical protein
MSDVVTNFGASLVLASSVQKAVLEVVGRAIREVTASTVRMDGDGAVGNPVQRAGANVLDDAIYDIVGAGLVRPPRLRGNLWMSMIVDPGHPRLDKFLKECGG